MFLTILFAIAFATQQPGVTGTNATNPANPSSSSPAATGFSGKLQAKSSNTDTIRALIFRVNPSETHQDGLQIKVEVNAIDGSFSSPVPFPQQISSIDTSPICLELQTLELRRPGEDVLRVVENGVVTQAAAENVGFSSTVSADGARDTRFNLSLGGVIPTVRPIAAKLSLGGINVGCVKTPVRKTEEEKR